MEDQRILVGTSLVIDHIRKSDKRKSLLYKIMNSGELYISSVSVFELYAGATDKQKQKDLSDFLTFFKVIPFTEIEAENAAFIYQNLKKANQIIEIPDIFIASTAVINNLLLVTLNVKDFERIKEVKLLKF